VPAMDFLKIGVSLPAGDWKKFSARFSISQGYRR
jgi:hypothetical protein